ncbi:response regulator [Kocuria sp.]|uniref:response regulator n=1 Tax=Kocuria sp. TaxID=1871328 RepID=UPI0026E0BCFC|nr:response regulator transcription factor [Kocuria sp.]MDO5618298.1 response regulator transcription factor [Kocuria sp.]
MIRVLLADDHALVRSGFSMVLSTESDIQVVDQVVNGLEAVQRAARGDVDVVLMDVQMPVMDGIEATGQIVAAGGTKVIILTTFDRDDYLFAALQAGASGFLLKNADPDDLIDALHAVADGHALLAPEATLKVIRELSTRSATSESPTTPPATSEVHRTADEQRSVDSLTERETQVLRLVADGMSNAEIAQALFLGAATVKTHVSNVLAKTGSRDRVQAVVFAYRTGLVNHPRGGANP